jgi:hypothetical protein
MGPSHSILILKHDSVMYAEHPRCSADNNAQLGALLVNPSWSICFAFNTALFHLTVNTFSSLSLYTMMSLSISFDICL